MLIEHVENKGGHNKDPDWESIVRRLVVYAYSLLDEGIEKGNRAEMAKDFAVEAITKYLENPDKFETKRNSNLIWYLKYNILRQLISNFKKSAFNNREIHILRSVEQDDPLEILYIENFDWEGEIDAFEILKEIESKIKKDNTLYPLFKLRYYHDSKKSEICSDLNIDPNEYNNRMKRLKRISQKIFSKYSIKS